MTNNCISTLPLNLCVKPSGLPGKKYGVWSVEAIAEGTRFGPCQNISVDRIGHEKKVCFQWQVKSEQNAMTWESNNENKLNWLQYVNYASSKEQHNLIAFHCKSRVYYIACKLIPARTELIVWHQTYIAKEEKAIIVGAGNSEATQDTLQIYQHSKENNKGKTVHNRKKHEYVLSKNRVDFDILSLPVTIGSCRDSTVPQKHSLKKLQKQIAVKKRNTIHKRQYNKRKYNKTRNYLRQKGIDNSKPNTSDINKYLNKKICQSNASGKLRRSDLCKNKFTKGKIIEVKEGKCSTGNIYKNSNRKRKRRGEVKLHKLTHIISVSSRFVSVLNKTTSKQQILTTEKYKCTHCRWKFTQRKNLMLHERSCSFGKKHQCKLCGKQFVQRYKLVLHEIDHRVNNLCNCRKNFMQESNTTMHEVIDAAKEPHNCTVCSLKSCEGKQNGEHLYKCRECGKAFIQEESLLSHEQIHSKNVDADDKLFELSNCGKAFMWKGFIQVRSLMGVVNVEKKPLKSNKVIQASFNPFERKVCGKKFADSSHLKLHEKTHSDDPPYKCNVCGKVFTLNGYLKRHEVIHSGEKPYECKVCGMKFVIPNYLKRHERVHTGDPSFKCNECGKNYASKGKLKLHVAAVHTGEKPFECSVCGKAFSQRGLLKRHENIHTAENRFECKVCGKIFSYSSYLKQHERIHTGESPYKCTDCGKVFTQNGHLKVHEKVHTGEKPYECTVCGKKFAYSKSLKQHQSIHTNDPS